MKVIDQSTIGAILDSEREMVATASERYGDHFTNAAGLSQLLTHFVARLHPDRFIFAMFLSHLRKHQTLALFSVVRLHHVQAMMDLRQVLEAGTCAAYALVHPGRDDFADTDANGVLNPKQALAKKRYAWLDQEFPTTSKVIKDLKATINASTAHSNIADAHNNFRFDADNGKFDTPFFDVEEEYRVKSDLWISGNIAWGLMDLVYGVNQRVGVIEFAEAFLPQLRALGSENSRLRAELMAREEYQRVERRKKAAQPDEDSL